MEESGATSEELAVRAALVVRVYASPDDLSLSLPPPSTHPEPIFVVPIDLRRSQALLPSAYDELLLGA